MLLRIFTPVFKKLKKKYDNCIITKLYKTKPNSIQFLTPSVKSPEYILRLARSFENAVPKNIVLI